MGRTYITAAERRTKAAANAAAYQAHLDRQERVNLAWRYAYAVVPPENRYAFVLDVVEGRRTLDAATVEVQLKALLGVYAVHPECRAHFMEHGRADYAHLAGHCAVCGAGLACAGEIRAHDYRELSPAEVAARGGHHFGACDHHYACRRCGETTAHDSSG